MFERYTQGSRRVIFFARYEASNYGSEYIETEHLLLGILREDRALAARLAKDIVAEREIRLEIEGRTSRGKPFPVSVEVPLSQEGKDVLNLAADSADQMGHRMIGTEHLLLGILRVENCLAAQILVARGLKQGSLQEEIAKLRSPQTSMPTAEGLITLESFLGGLKRLKSDELIDYFAESAEFIDVSGQRWNREELERGFDAVFARYAKKNASYAIETRLAETSALFVATVLWKNALLASEERVWMHRMSATLVSEAGSWKITLLQVTGVNPASAFG
jgi:ATP-dependent Clp protease ATP-binding subunit ClpA